MSTRAKADIAAKESKSRKRGGQPGNTNAFKHGFYTKNFSLAERRGLQSTEGVVLGDEIALLRVLIRRFAEQIQASQGVALTESAQNLAVVSEAMLRLASLLRTDHMLGGAQSSTFFKQLNLVLEGISDERALDDR
ncbi:MAG: hypothetical protein R6T90_10210 [Dissulfuribacterales bacterium]